MVAERFSVFSSKVSSFGCDFATGKGELMAMNDSGLRVHCQSIEIEINKNGSMR